MNMEEASKRLLAEHRRLKARSSRMLSVLLLFAAAYLMTGDEMGSASRNRIPCHRISKNRKRKSADRQGLPAGREDIPETDQCAYFRGNRFSRTGRRKGFVGLRLSGRRNGQAALPGMAQQRTNMDIGRCHRKTKGLWRFPARQCICWA